MPVNNPFALSFSGNITEVGGTPIYAAFYGSPAVAGMPVYVLNPSSGSVSVSGIVQVSATTAANSSGNPIYVSAAVSNTVTHPLGLGAFARSV